MRNRILAGFLLALAGLAGCKNQAEMPYFGKYEGGYMVESTTNRLIPAAARWNLKGYLQLLATRDKFNLHLEGEQETVDIRGTWHLDQGMMRFWVTENKFDDLGGASTRNPNRTFTPAAAIRAAIGKEFTLGVGQASGRVELHGALLVLGESTGHLQFGKDPTGH